MKEITVEKASKMGWFMWPLNFDPAWLLNCDGYTEKGKKNE